MHAFSAWDLGYFVSFDGLDSESSTLRVKGEGGCGGGIGGGGRVGDEKVTLLFIHSSQGKIAASFCNVLKHCWLEI